MDIKIEKGIPIPSCGNSNGVSKAIAAMVSGDSIVIELKARQGVFLAAKRYGKKLISRKIDDLTIRVWVK